VVVAWVPPNKAVLFRRALAAGGGSDRKVPAHYLERIRSACGAQASGKISDQDLGRGWNKFVTNLLFFCRVITISNTFCMMM